MEIQNGNSYYNFSFHNYVHKIFYVKHGYSNEFLDSDRVANVYFTSDVGAKSRISGLNDFYRINLNDVRRAGAHDDGVFNECKISDQESDDDIASINSKDNGDDADDDDDDDADDDDFGDDDPNQPFFESNCAECV